MGGKLELDPTLPRVMIDRSFVANYLRSQQQNFKEESNAVKNISIIDLDNSSDQMDDSVVFISEQKIEISPKTEIAALKKENSVQKNRIRKLEIYVGALQKVVLAGNKNAETPSNKPPIANDADLNLSIDEEWVNQEIDQMRNDGNFSAVAAELEKFLDENVE